jgi:hypothetical protein
VITGGTRQRFCPKAPAASANVKVIVGRLPELVSVDREGSDQARDK